MASARGASKAGPSIVWYVLLLAASLLVPMVYRYAVPPSGSKEDFSALLQSKVGYSAYRIYYSRSNYNRHGRLNIFDGVSTDIGNQAAKIRFGLYNLGWPEVVLDVSCRDEREILFWRTSSNDDTLKSLIRQLSQSGWSYKRVNDHQMLLRKGEQQVQLSYLEYRGPFIRKMEAILCLQAS